MRNWERWQKMTPEQRREMRERLHRERGDRPPGPPPGRPPGAGPRPEPAPR